jgi:hypothetical protein
MRRTVACLLPALLAAVALAADEPKPAGGAVLVDGAGKEIKLEKWKFAAGTRKLAWAEGEPEVLEFREINSTGFRDGVLTLVPVSRVKSLAYDSEKKTVTLEVAGREEPLKGFGQFAGINQIAVDAEVDRGDMGVAELRYKSGAGKGALRELRLGGKPAEDAKPAGEVARIRLSEAKKDDEPLTVHNLRALYRADKMTEKLLPVLYFKKTLKIDLAKVDRLQFPTEGTAKDIEVDVTLKDGTEQTLTLLTAVAGDDGKPLTLVGLVGDVPGVGWKLFPVVTLGEVRVGDKAAPAYKP